MVNSTGSTEFFMEKVVIYFYLRPHIQNSVPIDFRHKCEKQKGKVVQDQKYQDAHLV